MEPSSRHSLHWLPNALTIGRICLVPALMALILAVYEGNGTLFDRPYVLIGLFAVCALSDFLDGYLARKWNLVSSFGRMLDPIADKLLVAGCLIAFCIVFDGMWPVLVPAGAIIFRDILISGTREHAAHENVVLAPTKLAKWKTATEMLAIILFISGIVAKTLSAGSEVIHPIGPLAYHIGIGALWLAAVLSVWTGLHYVRGAFASKG